MHVYLFLWYFLLAKVDKNCSKKVYMEMVDIFLLEILSGCPKELQNTLLMPQ